MDDKEYEWRGHKKEMKEHSPTLGNDMLLKKKEVVKMGNEGW